MLRRYITVDVFTDRAFGGNPLAVVLDAEGLSTAQMHSIALEFNYSETTFVLRPRNPGHDAQVRIFTLTGEIPFAGHPNVGTAFVLATRTKTPPTRLIFEEPAGLVPVEILLEAGEVVGGELTAPERLGKSTQFSAEQVAACLSLSANDIRADRHPPQIVSVALPFVVVELVSREALKRARADIVAFSRILPDNLCDAIYFYTREVPSREMPRDLMARMFFPGSSGLIEDPATGSATLAAAALLADLEKERNGEFRLSIGQGVDMGRPSLLLTRILKRNGVVTSSHIGGRCVPMMEGSFRLVGAER
jgi:trans-2,3-dihydro-3-hydroxyanthranilate isomerase